ncbi:MAG: pilus assembly protein PilM [Gammaproteobacteria bacterium]|nr:pilus assembly protein PilM [Gammaproteobacteria bacterium]MBU1891959.1 pilus assembly protein PilM [Gammaproteobacteria bacterium]
MAPLLKHPKVAGLLRWWITELRSLLPAQWRSSSLDLSNSVVVQLSMQGVRVSRVDKGRLVEIGTLDFNSTGPSDQGAAFRHLLDGLSGNSDKVMIGLSDEFVLVKKMFLPLAVEENLENVLAFEIDRHTPFSSEQVYFDYRILHRDIQKNRMDLEIAVVPRETVDRLVGQLGSWGVTFGAVVMTEQEALRSDFNLLPRARRPRPAALLGQRNRSLMVLVVLLAVGALLLPVVIKREAVLQLAPVVERAKHAAEATDGLHRKLDEITAQHNLLLERKQNFPVIVALFDELTRVLPDDTWVQQFDLKGKELQIMGETGDSSKLIALMEQSKILHGANFRSPLTKAQNPSSERFHLGLEVKPLAVDVISAVQQQSSVQIKEQQDGETAKTMVKPQQAQTGQEKG